MSQKICPVCGYANDAVAKFCNNCGNKFEDVESTEQEQSEADSSANSEKTDEKMSDEQVIATPTSEGSIVEGNHSPQNKKRNKIVIGVIAAVVAILVVVGIVSSMPKVTKISAKYTGDKTAGTVLDSENDGINVEATYDNDTKKEVSGWTIEKPQTLKPDNKSNVTISYKDKKTTLTVACDTSTAVRLKLKYDGNTSAGTVIDGDNKDLTGVVYFKNGKTKDLTSKDLKISEAATLKKDKTATIVAEYSGIEGTIEGTLDVECSDKTPVGLTVKYNGDRSDGTVIDTGSSGVSAIVKYKNGSTDSVDDWTVVSPVTLSRDQTSTLEIEYEGLKASVDIECSDKTPVSITASYSGDTEEGTTIDSGASGMKVTATFKDGSTKDVSDWTVKEPVTLVADQTSTVEIHYGDVTTTVDIQCSTVSEEGYKASCGTVSYDELLRNPDAHVDEKVTFTGQVLQVISGTTLNAMLVEVTPTSWGGYEDPVYVYYLSSEGNFIEDDIVTIYGTAQKTYTYEAVLGNANTVPLIYASYVDLN